MIDRRKLLANTVLLFVAATMGCAGKHPATVSGKVTLDGKALTTGKVAFYMAGGSPAIGSIRSDGSYQVNTGTDIGLALGECKVTVVATQPAPPATNDSTVAEPPLITPAKYASLETTPFTFTVKAGSNTYDLPLTSN